MSIPDSATQTTDFTIAHPLSTSDLRHHSDPPEHSIFPPKSTASRITESTTQTTLTPSASTSSNIAMTANGEGKFDRFQSPAGAFPTSRSEGWEEAYERQRRERWGEKVEGDLRGWRGGNGTPRSGYSTEAVPTNSYYGQPVTGTIGKHLPKEIIRIERDWSGGEVCQFESSFPMELGDRITPSEWNGFIDSVNIHLVAAYSVKGAVVDNLIAIATWWTSLLWRRSHFESCLLQAEKEIEEANRALFNPAGLHVLSPRPVALQFMEIEYY